MKVLYKPFSMVAGIVGARMGHKAFETAWSKVSSDGTRPRPGAPESRLDQVVLAAALEASIVATSAAIANHFAARAFHHLFGVWPEHVKPTAGNLRGEVDLVEVVRERSEPAQIARAVTTELA